MSTILLDHWLPCIPPTATAQQKGVRIIRKGGKAIPMFYTKKKVKEAGAVFTSVFGPIAPKAPFEGPLALLIDYVTPWRAGESKSNKAIGRIPKDTAPDCSNIIKELEDVLTGLNFWKSDGQIAELTVRKFWGTETGIRIIVSSI